MNFEPGIERGQALEYFRDYLQREVSPLPTLYRKSLMEAPALKQQLKALIPFGFISGWTPVASGGQGIDYVTSGLFYEELARAFPDLAGAALIAESAASSLARAGSEELRALYLSGMLRADLIGCVAISEPGCGSNPREMQMRATRDGEGWRLRGEKTWITNGSVSDLCIVVAHTGDNAFTRFLVPRAPDGYTTSEIETLGLRGWSTAQLFFDDVWVRDANIVGGLDQGLNVTREALSRGRAFVALIAVGIAQAALDEAVQYARDRRQFGKPIAGHQLVQDMIAEMATLIEASRLLAYKALARLDSGQSTTMESAMAKQFATEAATRVTSLAIQVHGACGLSCEFSVERHFRNARMLTIPDGTTQMNRLIVGREILGVSAFA